MVFWQGVNAAVSSKSFAVFCCRVPNTRRFFICGDGVRGFAVWGCGFDSVISLCGSGGAIAGLCPGLQARIFAGAFEIRGALMFALRGVLPYNFGST